MHQETRNWLWLHNCYVCCFPDPRDLSLQCLQKWVAAEKQKEQVEYLCPMCRSSCSAYLHNCKDSTFERTLLQPSSHKNESSIGTFVHSPEHRIRRATYLQHCSSTRVKNTGSAEEEAHATVEDLPHPQQSGTLPGSAGPQVYMRTLADPAVSSWMRRELQALLQLEDPGFVQLV